MRNALCARAQTAACLLTLQAEAAAGHSRIVLSTYPAGYQVRKQRQRKCRSPCTFLAWITGQLLANAWCLTS